MNVRACVAAAIFAALACAGTEAAAQSYRFRSSTWLDGDVVSVRWPAAAPRVGTSIDLRSAHALDIVPTHATHPQRGAQSCDETRARALFDQGVASADRLEWPSAATSFQRSYEMCHQPRALRNLGLAHRALGQYTHAIRELEQFVQDGNPDNDVRNLVEQALTEMRANLASLTIIPSVSEATVTLDGEQVTSNEPHEVDPGNHVVQVTAHGYQHSAQTVSLSQHESRDLDVHLEHEAGGVGAGVVILTVVGTLAVAGGVVAAVLLLSHEAPPDCGTLAVCLMPLSGSM
jgi:hypothetical protein